MDVRAVVAPIVLVLPTEEADERMERGVADVAVLVGEGEGEVNVVVVVVVDEGVIADICCSHIPINSHIQLAIMRIVTSVFPSRTSSKVSSFPTRIDNPSIPCPGSPDLAPNPADGDDNGGGGNEACRT